MRGVNNSYDLTATEFLSEATCLSSSNVSTASIRNRHSKSGHFASIFDLITALDAEIGELNRALAEFELHLCSIRQDQLA